jgi:hypothetical protein
MFSHGKAQYRVALGQSKSIQKCIVGQLDLFLEGNLLPLLIQENLGSSCDHSSSAHDLTNDIQHAHRAFTLSSRKNKVQRSAPDRDRCGITIVKPKRTEIAQGSAAA